ncbi:MAG: CopG family transcriptional regulator [Actinomycetota bacterium]|nr:CopG family transcriptional regulator [Actinomycetota bacterium]
MRTTITFERDAAAAIEQLRRERGLGVSGAVNELIRRGLGARPARPPFEQRTSPGHARIDVTDIAEALEVLEGPGAR